MIINAHDIDELERYLEEFRKFEIEDSAYPEQGSVEFFGERPHLLFPLGFDESRSIVDPYSPDHFWNRNGFDDKGYEAHREEYRKYEAAQEEALYAIPDIDFIFPTEWLYRWSSSGAWYWFEGLEKEQLMFRGPRLDPKKQTSVDDLHRLLSNIAASPDQTSRTLWFPNIWTPKLKIETQEFLSGRASALLQEIYSEKKALSDILPRHLEELIAELLRDHGMDVHVTKQTRDGGRDVIARGEFIPGEPMILAVEVKQKPVVGIDDLYKSLKANEDFPALLLATSGRFSAGVLKEKSRRRNEFRLLLKDGVAISQWVARYGARRKIS